MDISDEVLGHLFDLELVVGHDDQVFDHGLEAVVVLLHVFDGEPLAQLQDELPVPIDQSAHFLIPEQFRLYINLDRRSVDDEFEKQQRRFILVLQVEHWYLMIALVQYSLALSVGEVLSLPRLGHDTQRLHRLRGDRVDLARFSFYLIYLRHPAEWNSSYFAAPIQLLVRSLVFSHYQHLRR